MPDDRIRANPPADQFIQVPGTAILIPPQHWWAGVGDTRAWMLGQPGSARPWIYHGGVN